jgi:hypothetical protein
VNYGTYVSRQPTAIIAFSRTYNVNPELAVTGRRPPEQSSLDDLHSRSINIAWAYLTRGGYGRTGASDQPERALFQYLMEHGDISDTMSEKLLSLSAI